MPSTVNQADLMLGLSGNLFFRFGSGKARRILFVGAYSAVRDEFQAVISLHVSCSSGVNLVVSVFVWKAQVYMGTGQLLRSD